MPATASDITHIALKVGLEIHVELATRRKMFAPSANIAHPDHHAAPPAPNTLIDLVTLGLPGALPVMNKSAVEMSIMVGLALGCSIAPFCRWDRKSYFYPDMPKNYQISQYALPLCFDGSVDLPPMTPDGKIDFDALASAAAPATPHRRIGIIRAHLEEDAGKLLHEAPGGHAIEGSLVDLNRSGTPLLEIVTQPDFQTATEVVVFCQMLRDICRFLGATEGIMQKGHIRFEPNINCILTLADGKQVATPVVEIKNLNSFKSVRGAIDYELREQPRRWQQDGKVMGPGAKTTRGWDDAAGGGGETFVQREKEDAHDYRYFPDPDLVGVAVDDAWRERIRARTPELPLSRVRRYLRDFPLSAKDAAALTDEPGVNTFYESTIAACQARGLAAPRAAKQAANFVLQSGAKRANERSTPNAPVLAHQLGITPDQVAGIIMLREDGSVSASSADELFRLLCTGGAEQGNDPALIAKARNMLIIRDASAMDEWCQKAITENPQSAADVRNGKDAALGRLVGAVKKLSAGKADAAAARERLMELLKS